ncbi:MAG: hypothetical protein ABJN75_20780 [Hoeflea sp.]|uniref:hypothetical protein n=1 Tax=Hoeflea sp. TaxID=1940281 RepID=UPI0032997742
MSDAINAQWRVGLILLREGACHAEIPDRVCQHTDRSVGTGRFPDIAGGPGSAIGVYALMQTLLPFLAFAIATGLPGLVFRNRQGLRVRYWRT